MNATMRASGLAVQQAQGDEVGKSVLIRADAQIGVAGVVEMTDRRARLQMAIHGNLDGMFGLEANRRAHRAHHDIAPAELPARKHPAATIRASHVDAVNRFYVVHEQKIVTTLARVSLPVQITGDDPDLFWHELKPHFAPAGRPMLRHHPAGRLCHHGGCVGREARIAWTIRNVMRRTVELRMLQV